MQVNAITNDETIFALGIFNVGIGLILMLYAIYSPNPEDIVGGPNMMFGGGTALIGIGFGTIFYASKK